MRADQLTVWSRACRQLEDRGHLARLIIDKDAVLVEVRHDNRVIRQLVSTAEVETAKTDVVLYQLAYCSAQLELGAGKKPKFQPLLIGGTDVSSHA